ncbi:hypothetical protein BC826DRAFT_675902 [Russula brevipes]|nr:hypothetical protein BC826DRAFT_675902 [Russula brevipes]
MASLPTTPSKRPASDSPQGEFQPAPVMAKTDHPIESDMQTVLSQIDMGVPNDAMVDTEIDDDTVNTQVNHRLAESLPGFLNWLDIATDDAERNEKSCSHAIDALASVLLPAVFDHSRNDDRVFSYKDIIKSNPWLIKKLIGAHESKEYHVIRRLRLFHLFPEREVPQETAEHASEGKAATVGSWNAKFIGNIPTILHGILRHHTATKNPQPYVRAVSHVQSSGTGKSRAHDELAKSIFYIPLNLAAPGITTYPPCDPQVGLYFNVTQSPEQQRIRDRCHAFLHALLSTTLSRLKDICGDNAVAQKLQTEPQSRLKILASEFRNKMAEGRVFERHGEYRRDFYDEVYRDAEEVNLGVFPKSCQNVKRITQRSQPSTSSNTADRPLGARSPQHRLPVRTRSSEGKGATGRPDENNGALFVESSR